LKQGRITVKKISLALVFALVVCSVAFVFAKEPADPKSPKSLEGKTWTIPVWDVSTKQAGQLKFELSLVIDKVNGTGKRMTVQGVYISQESKQRKPDVSNFESPITATKDGLKFGVKTTQGESMDAQILSDGSCRLQGPLGVATLKPVTR
jgi:hypothetical protein